MGTETISLLKGTWKIFSYSVKLNNPLMGTETLTPLPPRFCAEYSLG